MATLLMSRAGRLGASSLNKAFQIVRGHYFDAPSGIGTAVTAGLFLARMRKPFFLKALPCSLNLGPRIDF